MFFTLGVVALICFIALAVFFVFAFILVAKICGGVAFFALGFLSLIGFRRHIHGRGGLIVALVIFVCLFFLRVLFLCVFIAFRWWVKRNRGKAEFFDGLLCQMRKFLLVMQGNSNQEIAQQLSLALCTVKWHVKNIYGKLQVHNRVQLVRHAQQFGL